MAASRRPMKLPAFSKSKRAVVSAGKGRRHLWYLNDEEVTAMSEAEVQADQWEGYLFFLRRVDSKDQAQQGVCPHHIDG